MKSIHVFSTLNVCTVCFILFGDFFLCETSGTASQGTKRRLVGLFHSLTVTPFLNTFQPTPDLDIKEPIDIGEPGVKNPELLAPDQLYNLNTGRVPSKQETRDDVRSIIGLALFENANTEFVFPLQDILNATINGGAYPTIVPDQAGPLPNKNDIWCNPEINAGGCTTLGAWGRAFGVPAREIYADSRIGRAQLRAGDELDNFEEKMTKGFTETSVDYLEKDVAVQSIGAIASKFSPLLTFDTLTDPYWLAITNTTETLLWQPLEQTIDPPDRVKQLNQLLKDKTRAAAACRGSNGRLPNCEPGAIVLPTVPVFPTGGPVNDLGFYETIFVWGFEFSCQVQGTCISGTPDLQPQTFDGYYVFVDTDDEGHPIYAKRVLFLDFNSVEVLFIWQQPIIITPTERLPQPGSYGAITPTSPDFQRVTRGSRPPFAFLEGLSPPPNCLLGDTTNDPDLQWPVCSSGSNNWRFGRVSGAGCGGIQIEGLCFYPVIVSLNPSDLPF